MATPSIGGIDFTIMRGRVAPQGDEVEDVSRKGLDGHELYIIGARGNRAEIITVRDFDSAADAASHVASCLAYKGGALRTVTYEDGTTTTNVAVLDVQVISVKRVETPSGGLTDGNYLATLQWTLLKAQ